MSGGFKLAGEEEENDPAEEAEEYEEVELEDYTSYADTEAVQNEPLIAGGRAGSSWP